MTEEMKAIILKHTNEEIIKDEKDATILLNYIV